MILVWKHKDGNTLSLGSWFPPFIAYPRFCNDCAELLAACDQVFLNLLVVGDIVICVIIFDGLWIVQSHNILTV